MQNNFLSIQCNLSTTVANMLVTSILQKKIYKLEKIQQINYLLNMLVTKHNKHDNLTVTMNLKLGWFAYMKSYNSLIISSHSLQVKLKAHKSDGHIFFNIWCMLVFTYWGQNLSSKQQSHIPHFKKYPHYVKTIYLKIVVHCVHLQNIFQNVYTLSTSIVFLKWISTAPTTIFKSSACKVVSIHCTAILILNIVPFIETDTTWITVCYVIGKRVLHILSNQRWYNRSYSFIGWLC